MASIENTQSRLLTPPHVPGFKVPQWLPGKNPLDPKYWEAAKQHATLKLWERTGMIKPSLGEDVADPAKPPNPEVLEGFTADELRAALKDPGVPATWHPALERALAVQESSDLAKRLNPSAGTLKDLPMDEAKATIASEDRVDVLKAWADADGRLGIKAAAQVRIEDVTKDK